MKKVWIIETSSIEENRGSFCYLPYYLYSAYKANRYDVEFLEDFTITEKDILDQIKPEDLVFISLWSYPQIDLCRLLHLRLPEARFFGYAPLIEEESLPLATMTDNFIKEGMENYPQFIDDFKYLLLSDCDGHLKNRSDVLPLCTSYGCSRNCSFCPVTPNLKNKKRVVSDVSTVVENLRLYQEMVPGSGVHFTDEDFFYNTDRAKEILTKNMISHITHGFQKPSLIALAGVDTFTKFLNSFNSGEEAFRFCDNAGLYLVEIGMESADRTLAEHMGKPSFDKCRELAERMKNRPTKVLWLSLTLSPGETLNSIAENGRFLREYGLDPKEMSPRIKTNGTEGGLGQFFQLYHGTRDYEEARTQGRVLTDRQTRLVPSFIPNSLLQCEYKVTRDWTEEDKEWLDLYGVEPIETMCEAETVGELLYSIPVPLYKSIISVCVAARLGVIEQR